MYLLTSLAFPMEGVVQFKATLFVRKIWFSGLVLFLLPSWVSYGIFLKVGLENSIIWMKIAGFSFYQIKLLYCKVQGFLLKNWIHFASIHVMLYWFWKKNFTIHFLGNLSEENDMFLMSMWYPYFHHPWYAHESLRTFLKVFFFQYIRSFKTISVNENTLHPCVPEKFLLRIKELLNFHYYQKDYWRIVFWKK